MVAGQNAIFRRELFVGAALLALAPIGGASATSVVGTTGAANIEATSTQPGGSMRVIEIGAQVVENEKIETSGSGSVASELAILVSRCSNCRLTRCS